LKRPALIVVLAFLALGCGQKESPAATAAPSAPPAATPGAAPATTASGFRTVRGVVLETFGASDYTYMRLKTAEGETWAAVTKAAVKTGDEVTVVDAAPMDGFESKTLNRKFDRIVFGTLAGPGPDAAAAASAPVAPGHPPAADPGVRQQMATQHAMAASGPSDVGKIDVKKAEGSGGKTVAELFAQKAALKGQEVAVRGKVVKFTPGVMGRNWIHLRDGSGSREKKDDDVTVTTNDVVAVGDVVLVRGTLGLDKDFGAGYVYAVLIEGGKVAK